MTRTISQWLKSLQSAHTSLQRDQEGQSLVFIAFAFIGILAFVGLGVDLGTVYVERVETGRAVDAAALAAVSELPLEGAAHQRALVYLQDNGYDYQAADAEVAIDTYQDGQYTADPGGNTTIWVDTSYSQESGQPDTADHIRIRVRQKIPTMFMQFVGFDEIAVGTAAEAENINHIDTVIVYDESGSMEFDTLCYGCWEPSSEDGVQYPDGSIYPLPWGNQVAGPPDHCLTDDLYHERDGDYWFVIEAEEYSYLNVDYHDWAYTPYFGFWVMQRNGKGSMGRDSRGAYLSYHPYASYLGTTGLGVPCTWDDLLNGRYCRRGVPGGPFPAPRADYAFQVPEDDDYYFWVRGQGGGSHGGNDRYVFWGVDGSPMGREDHFTKGPYYNGASSGSWDWERLGRGADGGNGDAVTLSAGQHTFNLWAGGAGFDVDRIMITTDDEDYDDGDDDDSELPLKTASPNNGRTNWACNPCDPRFAGRPGGHSSTGDEPYYRPDCQVDMRFDDIYDDEQPIRDALESAKRFVALLNPRFDQVGYVSYDTHADTRNQLECVRRRGPQDLTHPNCNPDWRNPGGEPPRDPDCNCFSGVLTDTVLYELDHTYAGGSTNIGDAINHGIDVLKTTGNHYGRPGGAHVMILMTDGEANQTPNSQCYAEDLWPHNTGNTSNDRAKDCVVYYAQQARDNAIVVYTISLGWSADRELMEHVADITGGYHRWAPTPDRLDEIFDELYERIFIRLVK